MDWLLDVFATWLYGLKVIAITLAVIMFISGLDDFFIDVVYWVRRIKRKLSVYRRYPRMSYRELYKPDEKPLAIMVPAWNETGVIGNMAELAALTRKVGRKVRYVIVLRGQIVTGLRHWYARRRGHDSRAMLYNAVQHQWLTEQQTGEIWRQYVPHQFLFAEILTTLGHINRSAINVLLLRHERSSLPLGKFLVTEGVISQETLDRVLTIQRELQVSMQSLLLKAGLNTEQVAQLESENEGE